MSCYVCATVLLFSVQNVSVFSVSEKTILMFFFNILMTTDKLFIEQELSQKNIVLHISVLRKRNNTVFLTLW